MLDSWFLGRVSDKAAAGVGSLAPLLMTIFMALQAMAQAGSSISSQYIGGGRKSHARATQSLVIVGTLLLGLLFGFALWPLRTFLILHVLGLRGEIAYSL